MKTVRLTTAQAIVRFLSAQRTVVDGEERPLVAGVFGIFGHGNVTCLGEALYDARGVLPTYRGQSEQGMALAAIGFAKAMRRRQLMAATSSIGPGAMNMVTAAAVAHANRLPLLLLAGRHVPLAHPRSGAAAGRALRPAVGHGQRRVPARHALLGPHHQPGAGRAVAAARDRHDARPRRLRPGLHRPAAGRAGRGLGLSPCGCSSPSCTSRAGLRPDHRELAAAAEALRERRGAR